MHEIGGELDDVAEARALGGERRADVGEGLRALAVEIGRGLAVLAGADLARDEQELRGLHPRDLRVLPERFAEAVGVEDFDVGHGSLLMRCTYNTRIREGSHD
jgi:hypothetical protein